MKRAAAARAVLGLRPQIEKARITRRRACSQRGIVLSKMVKLLSLKHRVETYVRASTASQDLDVAEQLRVASWFGRRETTRWSDKELKSWRAIVASLDASDLDALERRYTSNDPETVKYRRHDLATLLNNWPSEADIARRWTPPQVSNVTAKNSTDETPWFEKPELPLNP